MLSQKIPEHIRKKIESMCTSPKQERIVEKLLELLAEDTAKEILNGLAGEHLASLEEQAQNKLKRATMLSDRLAVADSDVSTEAREVVWLTRNTIASFCSGKPFSNLNSEVQCKVAAAVSFIVAGFYTENNKEEVSNIVGSLDKTKR